jgi:hypothetical protein
MSSTNINKANWDLVVSYLHWGGANEKALTTAQQREVRLLGDGFGKGMTEADIIWDWSHVRDSSSEAVDAMAAKIRELVGC